MLRYYTEHRLRRQGTNRRLTLNDVEVDLHAGVVEGADHLLELAGGPAPALVDRVAAVGGEERQGHVAPGVGGAGPAGLGGVGLVDGQELDGGDAGGLEVGGQEPRALVGALVLGGDVGHALEAGLAGQQVGQAGRGKVADELGDAGLIEYFMLVFLSYTAIVINCIKNGGVYVQSCCYCRHCYDGTVLT